MQVLVILGILFVVGAVAAGRGDRLGAAREERPDLSLPPGPLRPQDVESVRFGLAFRGYRMDEVDAALDRLAAALADRDGRIAALEARLAGGDPASSDDGRSPVTDRGAAREAPETAVQDGEGATAQASGGGSGVPGDRA